MIHNGCFYVHNLCCAAFDYAIIEVNAGVAFAKFCVFESIKEREDLIKHFKVELLVVE